MKAAVYEKYGPPDVVHIKNLPKPVPKDDEVLVRVHASTVNSADWRARSLDLPSGFGLAGRLMFGVFGPRKPILGTELSGVIESVGKGVTARSKASLAEKGRLLVVLGGLSDMALAGFRSRKNGKKVISGVAGSSAERCQTLADLAASGAFTPVIDRTYPLSEIVAAHAYVDTGRKKGSVVITMTSD